MKCIYCKSERTWVCDSREPTEGSYVRRRRKCERCKKRFTTNECAGVDHLELKKKIDKAETSLKELQKHLAGIRQLGDLGVVNDPA